MSSETYFRAALGVVILLTVVVTGFYVATALVMVSVTPAHRELANRSWTLSRTCDAGRSDTQRRTGNSGGKRRQP